MIEIHGMEELIAKLDRLEKLRAVIAVMRAAALYLKGKFAKYPSQKKITRERVYGSPFASDLQRRWFFWALGSGELSIPYHRGEDAGSEAFGRSWAIRDEDGGLTQIIGNDTSYGPYLMGDNEQSLFSQAMGWLTIDQVLQGYEDHVVDMVKQAIDQELES